MMSLTTENRAANAFGCPEPAAPGTPFDLGAGAAPPTLQADLVRVGAASLTGKTKFLKLGSVSIPMTGITVPELSFAVGTKVNVADTRRDLRNAALDAATGSMEVGLKLKGSQARALGASTLAYERFVEASGIAGLARGMSASQAASYQAGMQKAGQWLNFFGGLMATPVGQHVDKGLVGISVSTRPPSNNVARAAFAAVGTLATTRSPRRALEEAQKSWGKNFSNGAKIGVGVETKVGSAGALGVKFTYDVDKGGSGVEIAGKLKVPVKGREFEVGVSMSGSVVPAAGSGAIQIGNTIIDPGSGAGAFINRLGAFANPGAPRAGAGPLNEGEMAKKGLRVVSMGEYFKDLGTSLNNLAGGVLIGSGRGFEVAANELRNLGIAVGPGAVPDLSALVEGWSDLTTDDKVQAAKAIGRAFETFGAQIDGKTEADIASGAGVDLGKLWAAEAGQAGVPQPSAESGAVPAQAGAPHSQRLREASEAE